MKKFVYKINNMRDKIDAILIVLIRLEKCVDYKIDDSNDDGEREREKVLSTEF